MLLKMSNEQIR
jgi:hypothetical protein